jgi:LemA protein
MTAIWGVLAVLAMLGLGFLLIYNRLVKLRNRTQSTWSDIDVHLTRRHELIPNLVATVQAYAEHERSTFEAVTAARTRAVAAEGAGPQAQAIPEAQLEAAMDRLALVAEAYPDLKADARFRELVAELSATENKVAFSRQLYNDTVTSYQTATQSFPGMLVAGPLGFSAPPLFAAHGEERDVVGIDVDRLRGSGPSREPGAGTGD